MGHKNKNTALNQMQSETPPMGYGKAGVGKMGIGKSGGKLNYENIGLDTPMLGQQGFIGGNDPRREAAPRHPPTGEKIFMSADGIPTTDNSLKRKRNETYSCYIYKVLKQVHPETGISNSAVEIMNSFRSNRTIWRLTTTWKRFRAEKFRLPSASFCLESWPNTLFLRGPKR